MASHVVPTRVYFAIFLALMVLTAITVAVAYVDLGIFNNVVALGIACTKASLVILYFMHVRYSDHLVKLSVLIGILFLAILFGFTLADPLTRDWIRPMQYLW
ncbi:MAG: cytochrome C oxidase subunit IV family protein [Candidatus Binatia bacterium]|nr:cytochrome C oxidase subunit IV family protein [Candidatus Binatia bacterium]